MINKVFIALATIFAAFSTSLYAHEYRYIGDGYAIQVGDDVEPPVAGQANGMDFFAFYESTPNDLDTAVGLDRTQGDVVEVVSLPLKLKYETFNSPITQVFPLLTVFNDTIVDGFPGVVADFTFPKKGTYGFVVMGKIKKQGHPDKYFVEKFVCGAGSQDTTFGTNFECVNQ